MNMLAQLPNALELELRERLAIAQEDLIDMARDAGVMQGTIAALNAQMLDLQAERDAWHAQATCLSARVPV